MLENKEDIKTVKNFLNDLETRGTINKQDILSLEEQIPELITDDMHINGFTEVRTSTNVRGVVERLSNITKDVKEESSKDAQEITLELSKLQHSISKITSVLKQFKEYDIELVDNVLNNCYLSEIYGEGEDKEVINYIDLSIGEFVDRINTIDKKLNKDYNPLHRKILADCKIIIESELYKDNNLMFPLLNYVNSNSLSIREFTMNGMTDITVKDLINIVVNKTFVNKLEELNIEISEHIKRMIFDVNYDFNLNDNIVFNYDHIYKKIDSVKHLLEDNISIQVLILMNLYLTKKQ